MTARQTLYLYAFAAAGLLTLAANFSSVMLVAQQWSGSGDYSHGPIIAAVTIFLIYRSRQEFTAVGYAAAVSGLLPLAAPVLMLMLGAITDAQLLEIGGLILLWPALGVVIFGWRAMRKIWVACGYLLFVFPVTNPIAPYLQRITTQMVAYMLTYTGLPVFVEFNLIQIPEGRFSVDTSCSGARFLLSALALGVLDAALNRRPPWISALLVMLLALLAMFGNWVRVYIVILVGHFTKMQHPMINDHAYVGWIIFAVLLIIWFLLSNRFAPVSAAPLATRNSEPAADPTPTGRALSKLATVTLLVTGITTAGPGWAKYQKNSRAHWRPIELSLPASLGDWRLDLSSQASTEPLFVGVAAQERAAFRRDTDRVLLDIAVFQAQRQGAELISDTNLPYDAEVWRRSSSRTFKVPGADIWVNEYWLQARPSADNRLVWQWYDFGRWQVANRYRGKLLDAWGTLRNSNGAASVAISADESDPAAAQARLRDFLAQNATTLNDIVAKAIGD